MRRVNKLPLAATVTSLLCPTTAAPLPCPFISTAMYMAICGRGKLAFMQSSRKVCKAWRLDAAQVFVVKFDYGRGEVEAEADWRCLWAVGGWACLLSQLHVNCHCRPCAFFALFWRRLIKKRQLKTKTKTKTNAKGERRRANNNNV